MVTKDEVGSLIEHATAYLTDSLLPFWMDNAPDPEYGGFLTYFDRHGKPTGETEKTFLMQIRTLFTMSSAHRAGYGGGRCAEIARQGAEFIVDNYWDHRYGGWYWIADREGIPTNLSKVGYGQCFGIYAFSEYFLATGDKRGKLAARDTYKAVSENMVDTYYGGYLELMQRDWQPEKPGRHGGDRKSMDVHMHMMEALSTFYEMTGRPSHRRRLLESIDILINRMLRPESGTGYIQFSMDFTPLRAILFETEWGRDKAPDDGDAHPLDFTSYGHNVEFAWLLLHAADILGRSRETYADLVRRICDHCIEYGIDHEYGGVYCEGPDAEPTKNLEKQFWQQGEVAIGMLDAYKMFGEPKYWDAFRKVWDFLFDKFVVPEAGGEWFERLDRQGNPVDYAIAHAWKINYHSVRSAIQVIDRLKGIRN